jgi:general secretion pathway protein G
MRRAFTLIEILIVMAILTVLAALLFPALRGAQNQGSRTVCVSGLRQIYHAFQMYAADHDDRLPVALDRWHRDRPSAVSENVLPPGKRPSEMPDIVSLLLPYAGNERGIFICPSDRKPIPATTEPPQLPAFPTYSAYAGTSYRFLPWPLEFSLARLGENPERQFVMDARRENHAQVTRPTIFDKTTNILMGDGHVEFK